MMTNGNKKFPLVQRVEFLKEICRGKKVLHLGCTNHPYTKESLENNSLLHLELSEMAGELWGFDYDQEGIDVLAARGVKNLYQADLENLEKVQINETFDVIVAGEMIEHLNNPGLFLSGIKRFMDANTSLVITTINAYCAMRLFQYLWSGKGGTGEPVHPDHVAYYSYSTLKLLLERQNMTLKRFLFYDVGVEHRPFMNWRQKFINDLSVRIAPQLSDGVIAECGVERF
jgi:ubiquinone/menaquinone biosynthesis C-methylase UbiE